MPDVVGVPLSQAPGQGDDATVHTGDSDHAGPDGDGALLCVVGLTLYPALVMVSAWSPGAEQTFGYRAADIVGQPASLIVPDDRIDDLRSALEALARGEEVAPFRTAWRGRDGRDIGMRVALTAWLARPGDTTAAAIVTETARAAGIDERMRQAQRLAVIGAMTAGIAHDFNNLVTVMYGYNELVLGSLVGDDARREYLLEVRGAAERATRLTRGLLAFGRRKTTAGVVDVNALIVEIEGIIRLLAGRQVDLAFSLCPDIAAVGASATQVEQVLVNLCVNARDAMAEGGTLMIQTRRVTLDAAAARPSRARPGLYTLLMVSDTGVGMDPSLLPRIWEPFFTTKDTGRGTGLGLSTLLAIVHDAGGFVNVESRHGLGSTFRIYLPAADSSADHSDVPTFEERAALPVHVASRRRSPASTAPSSARRRSASG